MSITFEVAEFTAVAKCTNQLRFVPNQPLRPDAGTRLQQAWEITRYDPFNTPIEQLIEWRDVPTDWNPS